MQEAKVLGPHKSHNTMLCRPSIAHLSPGDGFTFFFNPYLTTFFWASVFPFGTVPGPVGHHFCQESWYVLRGGFWELVKEARLIGQFSHSGRTVTLANDKYSNSK